MFPLEGCTLCFRLSCISFVLTDSMLITHMALARLEVAALVWV
jgi:hypothetical protein